MNKKYLLFVVILAVSAMSAFAVDIDGKVTPGEYPATEILKKDVFTLHWKIDGDRIHVAIEAVSKGWVAVGFDPGAVMSKSDMIFGLVGPGTEVKALDAWNTGMFGPHPLDTDQGGTYDILAFAGTRSGDNVVFEFTRLLDTKDKFDKVIPADGTMKVIWATGPDLVFTSKHTKAGSAKISFGKGK